MTRHGFLKAVGARVRSARELRGWSRRLLSDKSGVSERFLAQLEVGEGNISLARFADVAEALGTAPAELLARGAAVSTDTGVVALLGVRGAGKSTVGARLAAMFQVSFIEVDARIEQAAGLHLSEIFELHGEAYYRRLERDVLARLLDEPSPRVLATGGSIVTNRENFTLLRERAVTVWLRATPEEHWNRVIQQGDARPMANSPHAFAELTALLAARKSLYASAHHVVATSGCTVDQVVELVARVVSPQLERT